MLILIFSFWFYDVFDVVFVKCGALVSFCSLRFVPKSRRWFEA